MSIFKRKEEFSKFQVIDYIKTEEQLDAYLDAYTADLKCCANCSKSHTDLCPHKRIVHHKTTEVAHYPALTQYCEKWHIDTLDQSKRKI